MSVITRFTDLFFHERKAKNTNGGDPNIGVQSWTPGQPVGMPRNYGGFAKQGYRKNGTVYNCINKIAGTASGIKWKLYTNSSMEKEIPSHPLLDLWKQPNPRQGTGEFIEQMFGYWHISGNSYIWANRLTKNATPDELWNLRPDYMQIVPGAWDIENYIMGYGTPNVRLFEPQEVMHLKLPRYDDDWYGLSPIEVAARLIDQQDAGNDWNTALMSNAGKPASVFTSKETLTTEQRAQVKDEIRRKYSSARNAGMPLVLEANMTWQQCSMSPYELDWLQSRELNTRDIAAIMDIAPELVGDSAGKTYANVKEAKLALITDNVLQKMDRVVGHVNIWFVPMYADLKKMGAYFTYDVSDIEGIQELIQAKKDAQAKRGDSIWINSGCSLDEYRKFYDMAPLANGNGAVHKFGEVLVRVEEIGKYADQSLTAPAAPPIPQAEPIQQLPPATTVVEGTAEHPAVQPALPKPGKNPAALPPAKPKKTAEVQGNDEEEHTGVMIAFFLDADNAQKLALPDGEPASDLHVTLAYLGDKADYTPSKIETLKKIVADFAQQTEYFSGHVSGIGRFTSVQAGQPTPVYASVDVPGLSPAREDLLESLRKAEMPADSTHGFTPHITLAYVDADEPLPVTSVPALNLSFNEIWLAIGNERYSYPLDTSEKTWSQAYERFQKTLARNLNMEESHYALPSGQTTLQTSAMQSRNLQVQIQEKARSQSAKRVGDLHQLAKNTTFVRSREQYKAWMEAYT